MANRFWVGGSGTWDASSTTNWSASTGGAGGASAPVAADVVFFDANSGTGTCTTAAGAVCTTATLNSATLGLTLGADLTMAGNFTLTAGALDLASFTLSVNLFASNNTNSRSIAFGTGKIIVTGGGGSLGYWDVRNATNFSYTGASNIEFTYAGSTALRIIRHGDTAGGSEANAVSMKILAGSDTFTLNIASHIKTLDFTGFGGAGDIPNNMYGDLILSSSQTVGSGTGTVSFRKTGGVQTITTNGVAVDRPLTINNVGGVVEFQDALTQGSTRNFTITNGTVKLKDGATTTVGSFVTSGTNQKFLQSTVAGSRATLSQASGTVNANYLTVKDINATGGATWNAYTINNNVDAGNNLGWDFSFQIGRCIYTRRKNKRILP